MESEVTMKLPQDNTLDRILESAVVVSWSDLMSDHPSSLIQIEYGFVSGGTLDYLKVWSSVTRGHWLLACAYWTSASNFHDTGVHFENGFQSERLAHILDLVMQHQDAFVLPQNLGRQGLLQIPTPTPVEITKAEELLHESVASLESSLSQPAVA
jgi:hypothetical protein